MSTNIPKAKQPKIWLCRSEHVGDFNNALAVAMALSPDNMRIINTPMGGGGSLEWANDGRSLIASFSDNGRKLVPPEEFPDVILYSSNGYFHHYVKGSRPSPLNPHFPVLSKTLVTYVSAPDYSAVDWYDPNSDRTIVFQHQVETPDQIKPNMHVYDTVPSRVNAATLVAGRNAWQKQLSGFEQTRPVYFVIMGERLDNDKILSIEDAKELGAKVMAAVKKTGGSVVLTTSPRTKDDKAAIAAFSSELEKGVPFYAHDFHNKDTNGNPYMGLLALADKIIITSDSMSMASDGIATGKPVFFYDRHQQKPDGPIDEKHRVGHDAYTYNLLEKNLIFPMDKLDKPSSAFATKPYNSAEAIAEDIRSLWMAKQIKNQVQQENIRIMDNPHGPEKDTTLPEGFRSHKIGGERVIIAPRNATFTELAQRALPNDGKKTR